MIVRTANSDAHNLSQITSEDDYSIMSSEDLSDLAFLEPTTLVPNESIGSTFGSVYRRVSEKEDTSSADTESEKAVLPPGLTVNDVVCGRDKLSHAHPGNKRFRAIIRSHYQQYQQAKRRDEKTKLTGTISALVAASGGRFLRLVGSEWVEVDSEGIHEKVSHALRSAKAPGIRKKRSRIVSTSASENQKDANAGTGPEKKKQKRRPPLAVTKDLTPEEFSLYDGMIRSQKRIYAELMEEFTRQGAYEVSRAYSNPNDQRKNALIQPPYDEMAERLPGRLDLGFDF